MATFQYQAVGSNGDLFKGLMEAASRAHVLADLAKKNLTVVRVDRALDLKFSFDTSPRVSKKEIMYYIRQLNSMYGAGLTILDCLETLHENVSTKSLKRITHKVIQSIMSGYTLSEALAMHPRVFLPMYTSIIRTGEVSGNLGDVLKVLSQLLEHEVKTSGRTRSALRYPTILLVMLAVAFFIIVTYVFPKFVPLFSNLHVELPLATRVMIVVSHFFSTYRYGIIGATLISTVVLPVLIKNVPPLRYAWHHFKLHVPVLGDLAKKIITSRFSRMFSLMLRAGVPISDALRIVKSTLDNIYVEHMISKIEKSVQYGHGLTPAVVASPFFDPAVKKMVSVGEKGGILPEMLGKVSEYLDEEIDQMVQNLTVLIEPFLIGVIGIVVGFMMFAVLTPMWSLYQHLGSEVR